MHEAEDNGSDWGDHVLDSEYLLPTT